MNIAVVDDIFSEGENIKALIYEYCGETGADVSVAVFSSAEELYQNRDKGFSAVFTDILMPETTGMDMAKKIRLAGDDIPIIFVSSDRDFALEGYDVQAFDHLIKPVNKDRLKKVLSRLFKAESGKTVTVKQNRYDVNIPVNTIIYAEAEKHKAKIYTTKGKLDVNTAFKDLLPLLLENKGFALCHRGVVVNYGMVKRIGENYFIMQNDAKIYISRSKNTEIKKDYADYIFSKTRGDGNE